jgi:hypothetical protein
MDAHGKGALAAAAAAAAAGSSQEAALVSSLLPVPGDDLTLGFPVGEHTLWYAPPKPLFRKGASLHLTKSDWAGLARSKHLKERDSNCDGALQSAGSKQGEGD